MTASLPLTRPSGVALSCRNRLQPFLDAGVNVVRWSFLRLMGDGQPRAGLRHAESDMATLCYTSGSTGIPKGVVTSYTNWNVSLSQRYPKRTPFVICSFQPLGHASERTMYLVGMQVCGEEWVVTFRLRASFEHFSSGVPYFSLHVLHSLSHPRRLSPDPSLARHVLHTRHCQTQ